MNRHKAVPILASILVVIFLAGVVFESAVASPANWPMYRNNPLHTGVASDIVPPPLSLKWKQTFGAAVYSSPAVVGSRLYVGSDDGNLYAIDTATGNIIWTFNDGGLTVPSGVPPCIVPACAWDSSPAVATVGGQTVIFAGNDNMKLYAVRDDGTAPFKLWEFATTGLVRSSPVVTTIAGTQVVIFGSRDGNLYALVAASGAPYTGWAGPGKFTVAGAKFDASPAILGQTVFIGDTVNKNFYAVNLGNGVELWDSFTVAGVPTGAIYSSPAIANVVVGGVPKDLVFFGSDDKNMYALVAASGAKQWSFSVGGVIDSSPAVAVIPNPPAACTPGPTLAVIFGSSDDNLYAVRASDGTPCWTFPSTGHAAFENSPIVSGQTVYVGSDDDNFYAIDINTGTWQWSFPALNVVGLDLGPNAAVSGSTVYFGAGLDPRLYAFQPAVPVVTTTSTSIIMSSTSTTVPVTETSTVATATVTTGITQTQTTMTATTQTQTATSTSITTTQTQTATATSTTSTTTTVPSQGIPGFPVESILVGLAGGLVVLTLLGRRRRRQ